MRQCLEIQPHHGLYLHDVKGCTGTEMSDLANELLGVEEDKLRRLARQAVVERPRKLRHAASMIQGCGLNRGAKVPEHGHAFGIFRRL
jgi:hypothetical protein